MSYQDIYKGMVKQASAEQVKELAGMIKRARMNKNARIPIGGYLKGAFNHIGRHPKLYGGILGGTGLFAGGALAGNAANSKIRRAYTDTWKENNNLKVQNKRLKEQASQSGWAKLWQDLKKWWASIWENKSTQSK